MIVSSVLDWVHHHEPDFSAHFVNSGALQIHSKGV